jgi:hypothetical protein
LTPFECYCEYIALKQHFTQKSYDYIKYNGVSRASKESFERRNDKNFFYRLSKEKQPFRLLLSNFVYNDKSWIGDLVLNKQAEENYKKWNSIQKTIEYVYSQDICNLKENFNDNILTNGEIPYIIELYQYKKINIETVVILDQLVSCVKYWDKKIKDPLYEELSFKIKKYSPFVVFNKEKVKKITKEHFKDTK